MVMVVLALALPSDTTVGVGATVGVVLSPPPAAAGVSVAPAAGVSAAPAAGVFVAAAPLPVPAVGVASPPQAVTSITIIIRTASQLYFMVKVFIESLSSSETAISESNQ